MISKEQHMNIIENQRKIYEQIKEKQKRTTEKPMKNQRRNNEKQWKTMENQRQLCQHSKLPFARDFWSLFFRGFHLNGERNKRHF